MLKSKDEGCVNQLFKKLTHSWMKANILGVEATYLVVLPGILIPILLPTKIKSGPQSSRRALLQQAPIVYPVHG